MLAALPPSSGDQTTPRQDGQETDQERGDDDEAIAKALDGTARRVFGLLEPAIGAYAVR